MEVSGILFSSFMVTLNFLFLILGFLYVSRQIQTSSINASNQVSQTQHILLGISQFLEAQFHEVKTNPTDMIETAKSMIPLMIGKKLFPSFFEEMMPGFGSKPNSQQQSSLTEPPLNANYGPRSQEE
jgi:hypothetical protein